MEPSLQMPYGDEIEPSDRFEYDDNEFDEGTAIGAKTYAKTNVFQPPVYKAERMQMPPVEFNKIFNEDRLISDFEDQLVLERDEWKSMQNKIDSEYEKKLKEVSEDAKWKLKAFQYERESMTLLIRQLHQEYKDILMLGKNMVGEIYLVDILSKLHFIDGYGTNQNAKQIYAFMDKSKQNVLIQSDLEQFRGESEDIQKNLFMVTCAILNLQVNQKGQNFLEDSLLNTYLDSINHARDDLDLILINQLATIKNLIIRPTYSLTERQISRIHLKFKNMADDRESFFIKKQKETQVRQEETIEQQYAREFSTPQTKEALYFDAKNSAKGPVRNTQISRTVQKGRTNTMTEEYRPAAIRTA